MPTVTMKSGNWTAKRRLADIAYPRTDPEYAMAPMAISVTNAL
jgi:hypothetical protein